jgi:hypothetical protein
MPNYLFGLECSKTANFEWRLLYNMAHHIYHPTRVPVSELLQFFVVVLQVFAALAMKAGDRWHGHHKPWSRYMERLRD